MFGYDSLLAQLKTYAEPGYAEFMKKLTPGAGNVYGVRIPTLRRMAKAITKQNWKGFLHAARDSSFEEQMLRGMVIAHAPCPIEEKLALASDFIPSISNWAVCDGFCSDFKAAANHRAMAREFLNRYLASDREFELRFAIVMLLCYFVTDEYIDDTLAVLINIRHDGYYVKMAVAWAISVCFVKQREKTLPLIESHAIKDGFTHNKALQKIIESYRVSAQDKVRIKSLKR